MRQFVLVASTCASVAALACAVPATAQSQGASSGPKAPDAAADGQLADIVVTAEKRPSTQQRTPIAITVASGAELAANGATDVNQLANLAPTVQIAQNNANTLITIRGVSSRDYTETGDPAVAVSIDNFYLQRAFALNAALFDVDRVEVLRGPQGTLYGRNATAGAVNITTNKPTDKYSLDASTEIGNYGTINAEAAVNAPLTSTLSLRIAGARKVHDGYRNNAPSTRGDDGDTTGLRAHLLWTPDSRFSALLTGEYVKVDGVGAVIKGIPYAGVQPDGTLNIGSTRTFPLNNQGYTHILAKAVRGALTYDLGFATVSYFGGYQKSTLHRDNDQDGGMAGNFGFQQNEDVSDQNHELRIVSNGSSKFSWQGGLYYFKEVDDLLTYFQVHIPNSLPLNFYTFNYKVKSESKAAFAQIGYQLTDTLKAEGGIRYTDDKKSQIGYNILGTPTVNQLNNRYSGDKVTWHAGLNWQLTPTNLLYAKVDRGYKAGGYTTTGQFGPENITAYEVGAKNRFLQNTLQLNLSGFYYDYSDLQVQQNDPATALSNIYNAGKARLFGGEIETVWSATPDDKINLNIAYLNAKYTSFCTVTAVPCPAANDFSGHRLVQAPEWSLGGGIEHVFHLGAASLTARAQSRYQTRSYFTILNRPSEQQKAYSKTDLLLTYAPDKGPWSLTLFVRNLENSTILTDSEEAGYAGGYLVQFAPPRTYGARLAFSF
ncbi:TonB-dependent receptor [Sphingomonas azotifigens]|uniref:TonB-dependent receptor n=1 Tax=Sphingomonas azotifigens TaxID=330920 RepID=UPI0009FD7281|nr:TonB-dependent receptor [Sphingomonas azotifigens]